MAYLGIPHKYTEDVRRCQELGRYIKGRIGDIFGSQAEVADEFSELTGLKNISAKSAVNKYCTGGFVYGFSSDSDWGSNAKPEMHRRRLVILFTILGVEEGDPMVALAREINPKFAYPARSEESQRYFRKDAEERPKLRPETLDWVKSIRML